MSFYVTEFLNSGFICKASSSEYWIGSGLCRRNETYRREWEYGVFAPDFFLSEALPWWNFLNLTKVSYAELIGLLEMSEERDLYSQSRLGQRYQFKWIEPDWDRFRTQFEDLQIRFQTSALKKAVPVVFEKAFFPLGTQEKRQLLLHLLRFTRDLPVYPYGIWNDQEGILGASPELLFEGSVEDEMQTMALAGTRLKGSDSLSLLEDPKEREEHGFVVDGIVQSLEGLGLVSVGVTREVVLPTLSHLLTPISLRPKQKNAALLFETLVQALHPTPALGAYPKRIGSVWLSQQPEANTRGRFGAPFGVLFSNGHTRCIVGIRNFQWNLSMVKVGAGCGIIRASQFEKECQELKGKIASVKELFGL